jgi:hypothetical protein
MGEFQIFWVINLPVGLEYMYGHSSNNSISSNVSLRGYERSKDVALAIEKR